LSFGFLPFLLFYLKKELLLDQKVYQAAILVSGLALSILTLIFYRSFIGTVGRLSLAVSKDENFISPLALSYSGVMTMGVIIAIFFTQKTSFFTKILLGVQAGLASIPFFLGASRGSVLALIVPLLVFIATQKNRVKSFYYSAVLFGLGIVVVILSEFFNSSVIDRFTGIEENVSSDSSSASRLDMWVTGINQFLDNPYFGNSLETSTHFYPHNIIVEVLLSTGILGVIPFLYLVVKSCKISVAIFKNNPEASWVVVVFMQSLIQHLFSGAIYTASWLWFSMAFILSMSTQTVYFPKEDDKPAKLQTV
jgi:O-antigen ligase